MRGGARRLRARRTPCTLSAQPRAPTKQMGLFPQPAMGLFQPLSVWYRPRVMENVSLTRDGAIATVTLNRPERRNSLSDPMLTDLAAAFVELRDDTTTRVVIVT